MKIERKTNNDIKHIRRRSIKREAISGMVAIGGQGDQWKTAEKSLPWTWERWKPKARYMPKERKRLVFVVCVCSVKCDIFHPQSTTYLDSELDENFRPTEHHWATTATTSITSICTNIRDRTSIIEVVLPKNPPCEELTFIFSYPLIFSPTTPSLAFTRRCVAFSLSVVFVSIEEDLLFLLH